MNKKEILCPYCPSGVVMYKMYKNYQCPCCHSTSPDIFWFEEADSMSEEVRSNFAHALAVRRYNSSSGGDSLWTSHS